MRRIQFVIRTVRWNEFMLPQETPIFDHGPLCAGRDGDEKPTIDYGHRNLCDDLTILP